MDTGRLAEIFLLSTVTLFATSIGLAVAWARARSRAARAEGMIEGLRAGGQAPQQNLTPAIDAIAMEVERIGEGQRFLTKVLAEEQGLRGKSSRGQGASITPH